MPLLDVDQLLAFVLLDIAIILIVARLAGRLVTKIGQPRVFGEIVAGVLLGPTLLGATLWPDFVAPDWLACDAGLGAAPAGTAPSPTWCLFPAQARAVLGPIGQIALLLYMFLIGLGVDTGRLKGRTKAILLVGLGVVAVPLAVSFAIVPVLDNSLFRPATAGGLGFTLFVGAMLSVTSFPVMARILQEKGMITTTLGAIGIAVAAVCTLATFLTVSVALSLAHGGSGAALVIKTALSAGYLLAMFFAVRPLMARLGVRYAATGMLDAGFFAAIMIMLIASGFAAHLLGLNVIIGGFVAGLILPFRTMLFADLSARMGTLTVTILLPIFLAYSGMSTDFTRLPAAGLPALGLFLAAGIVAKWGGGILLARLGGLSWTDGNVLGVVMNCRGLMILVVSLAGLQNNVITPAMQLGGVLFALITTAMTGPLIDRFDWRQPAPPADRQAEDVVRKVPSG